MDKPKSGRASRGHFSFRGLITYLVMFGFVVMLVSGAVIFIAPSGRIAREVAWTFLGIDRAAWQSLHLSFAAVFITAGIVHIAFNWRGLLHYLRDRTSHHLTVKWDTVAALAITVWLGASAVLSLPPASQLHDWTVHFRQAFWLPDAPAARSVSPVPATREQAAPLPPASGPALPPRHPPVPVDQPCSDCHRR